MGFSHCSSGKHAFIEPLENRRMLSAVAATKPGIQSVQLAYQKTVTAFFESYNSTGTILTDVGIAATDDTQLGSAGMTHHLEIGISIAQNDIANGFPILLGDGSTQATTGSFTLAPDLQSARIHASIPTFDEQYGVEFTSVVDITFKATGKKQFTTGSSIADLGGGQTDLNFFADLTRNMVATGTVTVPNHPVLGAFANLTPAPSLQAQADKHATLDVVVQKPSNNAHSAFSNQVISVAGTSLAASVVDGIGDADLLGRMKNLSI